MEFNKWVLLLHKTIQSRKFDAMKHQYITQNEFKQNKFTKINQTLYFRMQIKRLSVYPSVVVFSISFFIIILNQLVKQWSSDNSIIKKRYVFKIVMIDVIQ